MNKILFLSVSALSILSFSPPLYANNDETEIKKTIETYFGQVDTQEYYKINKNGPDYEINIDLDSLFKKFVSKNVNASFGSLTAIIHKNENNTWHWFVPRLNPMSYTFGEQTTVMSFQNFAFEGDYSPELQAFTNGSFNAEKSDTTQYIKHIDSDEKHTTFEKQAFDIHVEAQSKRNPSSSVISPSIDLNGSSKTSFISQSISDRDTRIDAEKLSSTFEVNGLETVKLLNAWKSFILFNQDPNYKIDPKFIENLSPIFNIYSESVHADNIKISIPATHISMEDFRANFSTTGLTDPLQLSIETHTPNLKIESELLPGWVIPILPKNVKFRIGTSVKNAPQIAKLFFLSKLNNSKDKLDDLLGDEFLKSNISFNLNFDGNEIYGTNWNLKTKGNLDIKSTGGYGEIIITSKGINSVIDDVKKEKSDKSALLFVSSLLKAKSIGKETSPNTYEWDIKFNDASITINGIKVK